MSLPGNKLSGDSGNSGRQKLMMIILTYYILTLYAIKNKQASLYGTVPADKYLRVHGDSR